MNNLIQTHNGNFHADEVSAVAYWMHKHNFKSVFVGENLMEITALAKKYTDRLCVFRTPTAIENFDGWTFDIGRVLDYDTRKIDHHQDKDLSATNILVLNLLHHLKMIDEFEKNEWLSVFERISDIDIGKTHGFYNQFEFTGMITSFLSYGKGSAEFHRAITWAYDYICAKSLTIANSRENFNKYKNLEYVNPATLIDKTGQNIWDWKKYAVDDEVYMLIQPNREGWEVMSRSTLELVLPPSDKMHFRHNSGFLAVLKEFDDVIEYANFVHENLDVFLVKEETEIHDIAYIRDILKRFSSLLDDYNLSGADDVIEEFIHLSL